MAVPKTPPPASFSLVDPGPRFAELTPAERDGMVRDVDELVRPAVLRLAVALSGTAPALRAARNRLRRQVANLADGELIPLGKKGPKGAQGLTKEDLLRVLDGLEAARETQFSDAQQDLFARVCGPSFDAGA